MPSFLSLALLDTKPGLDWVHNSALHTTYKYAIRKSAFLFCRFLRQTETEWFPRVRMKNSRLKHCASQKITFYNKCFHLNPIATFIWFFFSLKKCLIHRAGCFKVGLQGNAADKIQCVLPQQSPSTWGRQTRSSREAKVNVCPCLPCQWGRMPLIIGGDKWLSRANPKLNKWLLCLFAQGFLHNKTGWEDAKGLSPILLWLCLPSIVAPPVRFTKSHVFALGWVATTKQTLFFHL